VLQQRLVAAAAAAGVFAAAVWLGWVDAARGIDLLTGRMVTQATAFALVATVCWLAVSVFAGIVITGLLGGAGATRPSTRRAAAALLAGVALLGVGIAHHNADYSVCCADASTAQQADQHVR
jgi:hypothetical protein